jgi:pimeloyl-ACP methyl ester carboxylesterase
MSPDDFGQAIREFFAPMARDPAALAPIVAEALRSDPHAVGEAAYELCTIDLRADAGRLSAPLLAILADGPYQRMIRAQLASVPDRDVVIVPRTRHFVMLDEPRAFLAVLDAFLTAHPREVMRRSDHDDAGDHQRCGLAEDPPPD